MKNIIAVVLLIIQPSILVAQSLSPDDLRKKVDEEVSQLNEYIKILNDTNPERSAAAVRIMMTSGNPVLERMAREFAIYSPHSIIQRTALEAFFTTGPNLEIRLDASSLKEEQNSNFNYYVRQVSGTIEGNTKAFFNIKVGPFNKESGCWVYYANSGWCLIRLSESSVSLNIFGKWNRLILDDGGVLRGMADIHTSLEPVPVEVNVTQ